MSVEADSPLTALGHGLMLSLVLQSRQRASRYLSLSEILPFLNLNTPLASIHGYGRSRLPPMIWPVMWSSGWSGETVNHQASLGSLQGMINPTSSPTEEQPPFQTTKTFEGSIQLLIRGDAGKPMARPLEKNIQRNERNNIPQPINPTHGNMHREMKSERVISQPTVPGKQLVPLNKHPPMPEDLVKPFVWHKRLGEGKHIVTAIPLAERKNVVLSKLSAPMKTGNEQQPKKIVPEASSDNATDPPNRILDETPERKVLPELNPALMGILGMVTGISTKINPRLDGTESFHVSSVNDILAFKETILPSVASPSSMSRTENATPLLVPLVSSPIPQNNRKPEQPIAYSFQSFNMITSVLAQLVKREVASEMKHQHESEAQAASLHGESSTSVPMPPMNDDMVRQIMYRLRDLAQEEAFRMGRIRWDGK